MRAFSQHAQQLAEKVIDAGLTLLDPALAFLDRGIQGFLDLRMRRAIQSAPKRGPASLAAYLDKVGTQAEQREDRKSGRISAQFPVMDELALGMLMANAEQMQAFQSACGQLKSSGGVELACSGLQVAVSVLAWALGECNASALSPAAKFRAQKSWEHSEALTGLSALAGFIQPLGRSYERVARQSIEGATGLADRANLSRGLRHILGSVSSFQLEPLLLNQRAAGAWREWLTRAALSAGPVFAGDLVASMDEYASAVPMTPNSRRWGELKFCERLKAEVERVLISQSSQGAPGLPGAAAEAPAPSARPKLAL